MPSKRQRRTRQRVADMPPTLVECLRSGRCEGEWARERYFCPRDYVVEAWALARETILAEWIEAHPGTRPWAWWRFDAPREPVEGFEDTAWPSAPQRQRLGGHGKALHEVFNYVPAFEAGIPRLLMPDDPMAHGSDARHAASPDDPPVFESEAAYLRRHGLLEPGEAQRIPAEAFEGEVLNTGRPIADQRI